MSTCSRPIMKLTR